MNNDLDEVLQTAFNKIIEERDALKAELISTKQELFIANSTIEGCHLNYKDMALENIELKDELASLREQGEPVGEVLLGNEVLLYLENDFGEPIDLVEGTKLFTHPPVQNSNVDELVKALENIKAKVVGEVSPYWTNKLSTTVSRGYIADMADKALANYKASLADKESE